MLAIIIIHHDDGEVGETAELCPVKQKREMIFLRARRRTRPRCGIQRGATPPPPRPHRPVGGAEACILVDSCEIREFKQLVVFLAIGEREREREREREVSVGSALYECGLSFCGGVEYVWEASAEGVYLYLWVWTLEGHFVRCFHILIWQWLFPMFV